MPSFKFICLVVQKKVVKVLAIYGHGGHLGHVTETIFIKSCKVVSEKKMFENNGCIHAFSPHAVVIFFLQKP